MYYYLHYTFVLYNVQIYYFLVISIDKQQAYRMLKSFIVLLGLLHLTFGGYM
jgi:hypothetical protein